MERLTQDDIVGREVVIRSIADIVYAGVVRSIGADAGEGELFELGRVGDAAYQRLVYVKNRRERIS